MPPQETKMEKKTVTMPEKQVEEMEKKVTSGEYPNFSDVVRSAVREFLERHPNAAASSSTGPESANA